MFSLPSSGHAYECLGGGGGWEVWGCTRCKRETIPSIFGFLWPEVLGCFFARWRCPGDESDQRERHNEDVARRGRGVILLPTDARAPDGPPLGGLPGGSGDAAR